MKICEYYNKTKCNKPKEITCCSFRDVDNSCYSQTYRIIELEQQNLEFEKLLLKIVKKRDERLNKSKETGDYEFCVAHGLTEAIRCFPDLWEVQ